MNGTKQYYQQIYKGLPLFRYQKKKVLSPLLASLNDYAAEHPDASYKELVNTFGSPDDVIYGILHNSTEDLTKLVQHRKQIIFATITFILLLSIVISILFVQLRKKRLNDVLYITSTLEIIDDFTFPDEDSTLEPIQ